MAIIDSGINPFHPHVNGVAGGVSFRIDENREIIQGVEFLDGIGHGTAIAGLIRERAPGVEMYAVKIFYENLKAPGSLLFAGLAWAIENNIKVIHLSLGTGKEMDKERLSQLCRDAFHQNIVIVAAGRSPDDPILPAALPEVIGVYWNRQCDPEKIIHHPGCAVEFGAYGRPRALPGIPENFNFSGHSFAAARMTARVAALLEANPLADIRWLGDQLIQKAGLG